MGNYNVIIGTHLNLKRCPHCSIAQPRLGRIWGVNETNSHNNQRRRFWAAYLCDSCGGIITVASPNSASGNITEMYPEPTQVDEVIPELARSYLQQAIETVHAPAGSVMLAASCVDAMLKVKNYKEGSLFSRIDKAAYDKTITDEMAAWAHEVRLDANDQRHADEAVPLPTERDAEKCIEFALALAEFLFILPAKVQRGRKSQTTQGNAG